MVPLRDVPMAVADDEDPPEKLPRRPFPRGQRPSVHERKLRIKQVGQLVGRGMEPHEAVDQLAERWGVRDPVTKRRYADAYFAWAARGRTLTREALVDTAVHQRNMGIQAAYQRRRMVWTELKDKSGAVVLDQETGAPVLVKRLEPDPDLEAAHRFMESRDRILGLMQPESIEAFDELLAPRIAMLLDVIRRNVEDPVQLAVIAREMRKVLLPDATFQAPARVVDATVVEAVPAAVPPGQNGDGGHP